MYPTATSAPYVDPGTRQAYEPNGTAQLPTEENGGFIGGTNGVTTTFTFNKNTATTFCVVEVYGPLTGTAYRVNVLCPT